jgi:hypothetical protein
MTFAGEAMPQWLAMARAYNCRVQWEPVHMPRSVG